MIEIEERSSPTLAGATDDEIRTEVRRRGYELHSQQFSGTVQASLREIQKLRARLDQLETQLTGATP